MLKKIGSKAREDMERFFGCKINLRLWVKVKEDWRQRRRSSQSSALTNTILTSTNKPRFSGKRSHFEKLTDVSTDKTRKNRRS